MTDKMTNYIFNPDFIEGVYKGYKDALTKQGKTLLQVSPPIIAARLRKNPKLYLEYGVYWWALKLILKEQGFNFGNETDSILASHYCLYDAKGNKDNERTIVAADEFANEYRETFFTGHYQFNLSEDGDADYSYNLFDSDMASL
jgi:hypothetical protein